MSSPHYYAMRKIEYWEKIYFYFKVLLLKYAKLEVIKI